ncbi:unnamed protein product [Ostreobium quekettii]|uniref:Uncharacterized protein n=1 Tax=Ostreobium quekettii TaxID=121088 RepID=A0A8S1JFW3_9CHLO|nr:unnamed protein product [Ostreobium quekettii]
MPESPKTMRLRMLQRDLLELQVGFDIQNVSLRWAAKDVERARKQVGSVEQDYQFLNNLYEAAARVLKEQTTELESLEKDAAKKGQQINELDKMNGRLERERADLANEVKILEMRATEQEKAHKLSSDERHRHHIQEIEALEKENGRLRQQAEESAKQEVVLRAEVRGREEAQRHELEDMLKSSEAEKRKQKLEFQATIAHLSDKAEELQNEVLRLKNDARQREESHREELEDLKKFGEADRRKRTLDAHADIVELSDRVEELQNEAIALKAAARDREKTLRQELQDFRKTVELEKRKQRLEAQAEAVVNAEKLEALTKEQSLLTAGARSHEDALQQELDTLKKLREAEKRQQRLDGEAAIARLSAKVEELQNEETILRAAARDREAALRCELEEFKRTTVEENRKERSDAQATVKQLSKKVESLRKEVAEKERKIQQMHDGPDIGMVETELGIVDRLFTSLSPESGQQQKDGDAAMHTKQKMAKKPAKPQSGEELSTKTKGKRGKEPLAQTALVNTDANEEDNVRMNADGIEPEAVGVCNPDLENRPVLANSAQPTEAPDRPGNGDVTAKQAGRCRPTRKCAEATNRRIARTADSHGEEVLQYGTASPTAVDKAGEKKRRGHKEGVERKQPGEQGRKRRRRGEAEADETQEEEHPDAMDPPQQVNEPSCQQRNEDEELQGGRAHAAKKAAQSKMATDPLGALTDKALAAAKSWKDPNASAAAPFKVPQPRAKARRSSAAHKRPLLPRSSLAHTDTLSVASLFGTGFTVPKLRKPELR